MGGPMSYLYLTEQGSKLGVKDNQFYVDLKDGTRRLMPSELLDTIEVFGNIIISTRAIEVCLKKGINVIYYSTKGSYYGRLISTNHINVKRQRTQASIYYNSEFNLGLSKKIIKAKINNQIVVLRRYSRRTCDDFNDGIRYMRLMQRKVENAKSIEELMGYEGNAAKVYFKNLGSLIKDDFKFTGRSKRPPKDEFNSLISLGYSILLNEIYGKIEAKGMNPYFGIMHKDREKHPTLASDLIEEWRPVIVDSLAMSMINGNELNKEHFYFSEEKDGIFINPEGFKKFIKSLDKKFNTSTNYISYINHPVSYRRAMDLQVNQLAKAIENEDIDLYSPIEIR